MIDPREHKNHIEMLLNDIEEKAEKRTMAINALHRCLVAARRVVEKMIVADEIEKKQGKEYFEAKQPAEKKPIKVEGVKQKTDNIKKPKI
jgi:hypothetical protein